MASAITNHRRLRQLRKLTEVSRALTYAVSLEDVLRLTVDRAAELFDAEKAVLMLTNEEGLLSVRESRGVEKDVCERFREPLQETLISRLQGLLGIDDPHRVLSVPLVVGGDVTGILAVAPGEPSAGEGEAGDDAEWLLSALADQAAVALEKTRLDENAEFRERLLGIVGHDLRSPLQAIMMAADALLRLDGMPDAQTKLARRIAASSSRMNQMLAQLLDFTRSRLGGGIPLQREPTHLDGLCRHVIDEMELVHPEATFRLGIDGDVSGEWDHDRIAQVLSNLVGNAIQHGAPRRPVTVTARGEGNTVTIDVHNEGPPIPPDVLPHIFDPFRQGLREKSRSGTSLGLGLYIASQVVRLHGGDIGVESSHDEGTTFTVRLPRTPPASLAAPESPPAH